LAWSKIKPAKNNKGKTMRFKIMMATALMTSAMTAQMTFAQTATPQAATSQATSATQSTKDGLDLLDKNEFKKAFEIFDANFKKGEGDAGFYMGRMIELGVGTPANPQAATAIYKAAAEKNSAKALNRVGLLYFRGEAGTLQNFKEAQKNLCKSADIGDKDGQFNCAELYSEGKGVDKNAKKAVEYYEKAALQNHIGALNILGIKYRDGLDVAKDAGKARSYFEKSGSRGNPVGLFELGQMFEQGVSTAKDISKAHLYYNLANARNHPKAGEALGRVSAGMSAADMDKAQNDAGLWKAVTDAK
jgi:uncharacterized protein